MSKLTKFYLDEHISNEVAYQLRQRGLDVISTPDAGRKGESDESNMAWALAEGRIIVTFDSDYVELHSQGVPHAGIAYFPEQAGIGRIVTGLLLVFGVYTAEEMIGKLEYL